MFQKNPYTLTEATKKAERYCTYRERCHMEVKTKLKDMGIIPEARDTIMVHLIENGFLNEERYAKAFASGKFSIKKWGKNRIANELKNRGISQFNIKTALKEIGEEEYLHAFEQLAKKRWDSLNKYQGAAKKRKMADFLFYRGWENELVYAKIKELTQ